MNSFKRPFNVQVGIIGEMRPGRNFASMLATAGAGVLYSTVFYHLSFAVGTVAFGPIDTIFTVTGLFIFGGGFYATLKLRNKKKPDRKTLNRRDIS